MKKIIVSFFILLFSNFSFAQSETKKSEDTAMKEQIYQANKKKVMNFSMKDFKDLFFEFAQKKTKADFILSREEFYNYTIKIAAFSDRLAALYPEEKETAEKNKEVWFSENYEDYLLSKASQKK